MNRYRYSIQMARGMIMSVVRIVMLQVVSLMSVKKLCGKLSRYRYPVLTLVLGIAIIPLGAWSQLAKGFLIFTDSLIGLSAAFTAWWAYKTFAFKERINEYKNVYEGLKKAETAYLEKYGETLRLLNTLSEINVASSPDVIANYKEQIDHIEREYREAEYFLNDLFFSPFVSKNFKAQLLLLIRAKEFSNATEVQNAFFKIKILHQEEFIIKT